MPAEPVFYIYLGGWDAVKGQGQEWLDKKIEEYEKKGIEIQDWGEILFKDNQMIDIKPRLEIIEQDKQGNEIKRLKTPWNDKQRKHFIDVLREMQ